MTEITVVRNDGGTVTGFEATGHSGDQPAGSNVTCASITVVFEFLSEVAEELPEEGIAFLRDEETTRWSLEFRLDRLAQPDRHLARTVMERALSLFRKLEERDPDSCRVLDTGG